MVYYSCRQGEDETCDCNAVENKRMSSNSSSSDDCVEISVVPAEPEVFVIDEKEKKKKKIMPSVEVEEMCCLPLSNDENQRIQAVVKSFRKKPYLHIRKFFKGTNRQGVNKWIPTKQGVVLKPEELKALLKEMKHIVSCIETLQSKY